MLVANNPASDVLESAHTAVKRASHRVPEVLLWIAGVVFALILPLALVVGAVLVSSFGIPLPIEVRVP